MEYRLLVRVAATLGAAALSIASTPTHALEPTRDTSTARAATTAKVLADQVALEPGGQVVGRKIFYPDGKVFVAVDPGTYSLSQCSAGQFCVWSGTGYSGSFTYRTGANVTPTLGGPVGSFYNNRGRAAWLYSNTGVQATCYDPRDMRASVPVAYNSAQKVFLSDAASC
jgi:hypothetical protein